MGVSREGAEHDTDGPSRSSPPSVREALLSMVEMHVGPIRPSFRRAMLAVDRARFVRREDVGRAWLDEPLGLESPYGFGLATISAPHMYVLQFEALDLREGSAFLELGTGSGYGAALASEIVGPSGRVTSVEVDPHLVELARALDADRPNVEILHDDGLLRPDLAAEHDKIAVTFAAEETPNTLLYAMRPGSVLVAPVGAFLEDQHLLRYLRTPVGLETDDLGPVRFVPARSRID